MLGPIFNREFLTVPRRPRYYLGRVTFILALWIIGLTAWLATIGWSRGATLGEAARFGPLFFQILSLVLLSLFLFFSALASASAVAQEKDRRTFILLLMTDLSNAEIVLGKVLGSLLPIVGLLLASVPMLMVVVLLGGVSLLQVIQTVVIVAATILAAGSLGGLVALWRERTFQSLALTVLLLVLYLCLARGLSVLPLLTSRLSEESALRCQLWLDPFRALQSVQDPTSLLQEGLAPAYGYALVMVGATVALNLVGVLRLRIWNPSGEPIMQREQPDALQAEAEAKDRARAHAAPGKVRQVGENPILWREIFTRAYGRRPLLVKTAYVLVLALICYSALGVLFRPGPRPSFVAAYGLLPVGILSLLLVAAQAATAITSERDTGALDLLLVTDLTPREFIFGKLGGIAYNTKEYLIPPLILAGVYGWYHCLATPPRSSPELAGSMNATALVCLLLCLLMLLFFAIVLGLHVALRTQNSRLAVIHTLSTIFFLSVGTLICLALILISGRFEYQWTSFLFFLGLGVGGLWWVLNGSRPSAALGWASALCPLAVLYTVMNLIVGRPGTPESADPLTSCAVILGSFGFTVAAMLVPLVSEFDVALGRTTGGGE